MANIGGEKYPGLSVEEAIEVADVLVNDFGGKAKSQEAFAQSLGHNSANSGTYYTKIADVRRYGLMQSRGIEATDLAHQAANPRNDQELAEAKFEMYRNIDVISEVYDSLNGNDPPDDFWRVISEVTGANPKEAREAEDDIEELYEGMREVKREIERSKEKEDQRSHTESQPKEETSENIHKSAEEAAIFVKVGEEELRLSEVSDTYIDLARDFLERMKARDVASEGSESDDNELTQAELQQD